MARGGWNLPPISTATLIDPLSMILDFINVFVAKFLCLFWLWHLKARRFFKRVELGERLMIYTKWKFIWNWSYYKNNYSWDLVNGMVYIRTGLIMKPFATIIVTVVELVLQAIPNGIWDSWPFTLYIIL